MLNDKRTTIPSDVSAIAQILEGSWVFCNTYSIGIVQWLGIHVPGKGCNVGALVSLSDKKRNGSGPDLRVPVVPVDFIYSRLIFKESARNARPIIRRLSVYGRPSRNSQISPASQFFAMNYDWIGSPALRLIFWVNKRVVYRGFLCHRSTPFVRDL
jgi:hypothetical protein